MEIKRAAIIGFGAIGGVYGRRLYHLLGDDFAVAAGGERAKRLRVNGVTVNGDKITPNVVEPNSADWKADLVIFSVKNYQLESAISDVRNIIAPNTILLTILNGVSARDRIKEAYPDNTVLYGLSKSDAERTANGINCSWEGVIQFGEAYNSVMSDEVRAVKELFDRAGIPNEVCEDMLRATWVKFMRNVGMNQLSALMGASYGAFTEIPELKEAYRAVMTEVMKVAAAKGINIIAEDVEESVRSVAGSAADGKTSMLQDAEAGRRLETDSFAGTMIKEGEATGVPTPWNNALYLLLKTKEALYNR